MNDNVIIYKKKKKQKKQLPVLAIQWTGTVL